MSTTFKSVFRNLACLALFIYSSTTVLELQTLLFLFFFKSVLPNWGCGLSKDAAYTRTFTVFFLPYSCYTVDCKESLFCLKIRGEEHKTTMSVQVSQAKTQVTWALVNE